MSLEDLRSFATNPRVRTQTDPGRVNRFSEHRDFDDYKRMIEGRADWLRVPHARRSQVDAEVLAAIDEAAAMGDKWARRLQKEINDGTFNFSYEPGFSYDGLAAEADHVLVNPFRHGNVRSGDEVASILLHEYVHTYRGPRKFAADFNPEFAGAPNAGKYNEGRAFLAEAIFNRNLAKARQLNGKPIDTSAMKDLNTYLGVDSLPQGEAANYARGRRAFENLQEYLVDELYGPGYVANPPAQNIDAFLAERLSNFRGGSMENIQKYIREQVMRGEGSAEEIMTGVLEQVRREGGRFVPP